jgi:hypothetical protein
MLFLIGLDEAKIPISLGTKGGFQLRVSKKFRPS